LRVVLDTNILVSALINVHGTPARILDLVLVERLTLTFDDRIISEYREVLLRPKFGFRTADVDALLEFFQTEGESVVAPPLSLRLPDADDAPFIEVAVAAGCDYLITGNVGHFPEAATKPLDLERPFKVITPAGFLEQEHSPPES
jgi:putative PIN family toxin of toxin-antitoxin system